MTTSPPYLWVEEVKRGRRTWTLSWMGGFGTYRVYGTIFSSHYHVRVWIEEWGPQHYIVTINKGRFHDRTTRSTSSLDEAYAYVGGWIERNLRPR